MSRIAGFLSGAAIALVAATMFAPAANSASTVALDVPPLATAGSARSFQFVSFQFNLYLVPIGDPETDYSANVLANDHENYTYEHAGGGGSGRGGGYHPPHYIRGPGATYSATYQNVTSPPTLLDAFFHFSGADVAGLPLAAAVSDSGTYALTLTADADATHSPITLGTPLSNGLYTLELQTDSLSGSQVTFTVAPIPGDFNNDGVVNAADFGVWRKGLGTTYTQADFDLWRTHYGQSYASGAAGLTTSAVPEPTTAVAMLTGAISLMFARRLRRRIAQIATTGLVVA
jgi:hypothetical protein